MKEQILKRIYTVFSKWNSTMKIACRRGCAVCCTRNVTITALEGEIILRYVIHNNIEQWFGEKLRLGRTHHRPLMTTNDFARACLQQRDVGISEESGSDPCPCPFLENNLCRIYTARPFSCRMMISETTCTSKKPAILSDHYLSASTAVTQILEHLGQKEYWGNMLDVLPALCDISEYGSIARHLTTTAMMQGRLRTLTAKPLPGFLYTEEEEKTIAPLLKTIFNTEVEGKRIEDILNGR